MGLDMYLTASKYIGGGWPLARYDNPFDKKLKTLKDPIPDEVVQFDAIIDALGFGEFDEFHSMYPHAESMTVELTVAYWRKANAVHRWFVENVQNGVDDCGSYYVSREQMEQLRTACEALLKTVNKGEPVPQVDSFGHEYDLYPDLKLDVELAKSVLGTQEGFFFGSTDYDQWYVDDLEITVKQIDTILNDERFATGWEFKYESSW